MADEEQDDSSPAPPGDDGGGEVETGETEAIENGTATELQTPEDNEGEGGETGNEGTVNETEGEVVPDSQTPQLEEPGTVEIKEDEVQTEFSFSPTASNTEIAHQLLATLEDEGSVHEFTETEESAELRGAEVEVAEGEETTGEEETERQDTAEVALEEEVEQTVIDDWIKERTGKKPKPSRAMWDYSLRATASMIQVQIKEEELILSILPTKCQPMWDYNLLADQSMIQSQVDESFELKLQLSSRKCQPMWDYQLSVPPDLAENQMFFEEPELRFEFSSMKCYPMWDFNLSAPIQEIPEEIYWVPSYLNFVGVTREKFFQIEETPNTKFVQTELHFDPDIIIQPEDLLVEPKDGDMEKQKCYQYDSYEHYISEEMVDTVVENEDEWYPPYLNVGEMQIPYKVVFGKCVVLDEDAENSEEQLEEHAESESDVPVDVVMSTEVQTDVGLGELLQSESISSIPDTTDITDELQISGSRASRDLTEEPEVSDIEESNIPTEIPEETSATNEESEEQELDVPWAILSESVTAVAPAVYLPPEDDILSTVSLAPMTERQEDTFNFAITLGGSQWGFPEYTTDDDHNTYGSALPQTGEDFTWTPDVNKPFESSMFAPMSEEDAMLLESLHTGEALQQSGSGTFRVSDILENDNITEKGVVAKLGKHLTTPVIEVEIMVLPSSTALHSSDTPPQIEVELEWEAIPNSAADGPTSDVTALSENSIEVMR